MVLECKRFYWVIEIHVMISCWVFCAYLHFCLWKLFWPMLYVLYSDICNLNRRENVYKYWDYSILPPNIVRPLNEGKPKNPSISHWKYFKSKLIYQTSSFVCHVLTESLFKGIELPERTLDRHLFHFNSLSGTDGLHQCQHVCVAFYSTKFSYAPFSKHVVPLSYRGIFCITI